MKLAPSDRSPAGVQSAGRLTENHPRGSWNVRVPCWALAAPRGSTARKQITARTRRIFTIPSVRADHAGNRPAATDECPETGRFMTPALRTLRLTFHAVEMLSN